MTFSPFNWSSVFIHSGFVLLHLSSTCSNCNIRSVNYVQSNTNVETVAAKEASPSCLVLARNLLRISSCFTPHSHPHILEGLTFHSR